MVREVMELVLEAVPAILAEDTRLDEKYGIDPKVGVDVFSEASIRRAFAKNRKEDALERMLMKCDDESLLKFESLIYYGRDKEECPYRDKLKYLRRMKDPRHELVRTILEKLPSIRKYVVVALRKLKAEGLTIDTI